VAGDDRYEGPSAVRDFFADIAKISTLPA